MVRVPLTVTTPVALKLELLVKVPVTPAVTQVKVELFVTVPAVKVKIPVTPSTAESVKVMPELFTVRLLNEVAFDIDWAPVPLKVTVLVDFVNVVTLQLPAVVMLAAPVQVKVVTLILPVEASVPVDTLKVPAPLMLPVTFKV